MTNRMVTWLRTWRDFERWRSWHVPVVVLASTSAEIVWSVRKCAVVVWFIPRRPSSLCLDPRRTFGHFWNKVRCPQGVSARTDSLHHVHGWCDTYRWAVWSECSPLASICWRHADLRQLSHTPVSVTLSWIWRMCRISWALDKFQIVFN